MRGASLHQILTAMSPSRPLPHGGFYSALKLHKPFGRSPSIINTTLDLTSPNLQARRREAGGGVSRGQESPSTPSSPTIDSMSLLLPDSYSVNLFPVVVVRVDVEAFEPLLDPPARRRRGSFDSRDRHHLFHRFESILNMDRDPPPPLPPSSSPNHSTGQPRAKRVAGNGDVLRKRPTTLRVVERPQHLMIFCVTVAMIHAGKLEGAPRFTATITRRRMRLRDGGGGRSGPRDSALRHELVE